MSWSIHFGFWEKREKDYFCFFVLDIRPMGFYIYIPNYQNYLNASYIHIQNSWNFISIVTLLMSNDILIDYSAMSKSLYFWDYGILGFRILAGIMIIFWTLDIYLSIHTHTHTHIHTPIFGILFQRELCSLKIGDMFFHTILQ